MNILQLKPNESKVQTRLSMAGLTSAACLYAGLGGSLAAMFSIPVSTAALIAGAAVLLLSLLLRRASFRGMILAGIAVGGMAVGLIWGDLGGGLYGIINQVSSAIGGHIGRNLARFTASESGMNYACAYLSALLAMGCVWLVQNRCTLVAALIALVLAALDVLLGVAAPALWIALLAAGLILLNLSAGILKRDSKGGAIVWLSLLLSAAIFVSGGLFLLEKHEIPGVAALRKQALALISEWRYGKDGGLPDGDFSNLGSLNQTDSVMLEVSMDKPESLYLRGFVGSEYNGNGWNEANPTSLSDGAELFYWLHRSGFYGQTQLASAALDLDDALTEEDVITISVRHIGASRAQILRAVSAKAGIEYDVLCVDDCGAEALRMGKSQRFFTLFLLTCQRAPLYLFRAGQRRQSRRLNGEVPRSKIALDLPRVGDFLVSGRFAQSIRCFQQGLKQQLFLNRQRHTRVPGRGLRFLRLTCTLALPLGLFSGTHPGSSFSGVFR